MRASTSATPTVLAENHFGICVISTAVVWNSHAVNHALKRAQVGDSVSFTRAATLARKPRI